MSADPKLHQGWGAHALQLIAFPRDPMAGMNQEWFEAVTGVSPVTEKSKTRREDRAEVEGRTWMLVSEVGKINWFQTSVLDTENAQQIPTMGDFGEALESFIRRLSVWWPTSPPLWRVGLAGKLVIPTRDREHSYELLGHYLRETVKLDPKGSSDFLYRINRPCDSVALPGRQINRIVTWNAMKLEMHMGSSALPPGQPALKSEFHGCGADLDINTSQEVQDEIHTDRIPALLKEMSELALQIADKGDVLC